MKRESLLLVLTVANILFLIMSVCCLIWTAKNNQIFNSIEKDFSYEEYENGKVILSLKGGKKMTLIFGNASVKVVDSYQATSKEESISVALFIRYYTRLNGIETARSNTDFTGEYRLHNCLYKLGYKSVQTKNADIDYVKDRRWYVNVASSFICWIGI